MKRFQQLIYLIILMVFANISNATPVKEQTLHQLLMLSGIEAQMQDLSKGIKAGVMASSGGSGKFSGGYEKLFNQLVEPDAIYAGVIAEVSQVLTEAEGEFLIAWYESNLGNRLARAEEFASSPEGMAEMQVMSEKIVADVSRMEMASRLAEASGVIDKGMKTQNSIMLAIQVAASKLLSPNEPIVIETLRQALNEQQPRIALYVEQSILTGLAYTFRDFNEDELSAYIEMLKQPAMQKYNNSGLKGTENALEYATKMMASSFSDK